MAPTTVLIKEQKNHNENSHKIMIRSLPMAFTDQQRKVSFAPTQTIGRREAVVHVLPGVTFRLCAFSLPSTLAGAQYAATNEFLNCRCFC